MQPFCLQLACWEGGPSLKSKSKSTFDDLLRWSMSVIVVSSGLMQLIWKSMGDIMFHREYNWEVRNTVIPSKLYLWPLCPGPVRVQGIVFLQQSQCISEKVIDGSVRPTGRLRLYYKWAHPPCRSGKAWNLTVSKGSNIPKDLRR